jgi:hypothetical protein
MQDRQIDQAGFFGMSHRQLLDTSLTGSTPQQHLQEHTSYPSAAEASASKLLNHFQSGFQPHTGLSHSQGMSGSMSGMSSDLPVDSSQLLQEISAMRRLQQQQQQLLRQQQLQLQQQQQQIQMQQMQQQMNNFGGFNGMGGGFNGGMGGGI